VKSASLKYDFIAPCFFPRLPGTDRAGCRLKITFVDKDGDRHTLEVAAGDNLLDIAQANDIEMEGMHCLYSQCDWNWWC
jgi:hypothetical protein